MQHWRVVRPRLTGGLSSSTREALYHPHGLLSAYAHVLLVVCPLYLLLQTCRCWSLISPFVLRMSIIAKYPSRCFGTPNHNPILQPRRNPVALHSAGSDLLETCFEIIRLTATRAAATTSPNNCHIAVASSRKPHLNPSFIRHTYITQCFSHAQCRA